MDLNVAQLRALFEPFDLSHLLRLWIVLALCIFLWGSMIATCGGFSTLRQFWRIHLLIIGAVFLFSGVAFLFFSIDPLFLLLSLSALAFVAQGDLAAHSQKVSLQPRRSLLFRQHRSKEPALFEGLKRLEPGTKKRRSL